MKGKKPVTFLTDQDAAIAAAAKQVFPDVFHALCFWHLKENGLKRLGSLGTGDFTEFRHLVEHVDSEDELELGWKWMIRTSIPNLDALNRTWLESTYQIRKQWSSAWVKDYFTTGKTTTHLVNN